MGSGDSDTARCLVVIWASVALERFYWKNVSKDIKDFVLACDRCQKVNPVKHIEVAELHSVSVPVAVMAQIGFDFTNLPRTEDGFCCVVVAMDYFSKWPEARALRNHTAESVAKFIFEDTVCRHGCIKVQINDRGHAFVNKVSAELHRLTGTKQHLTSAYHPQANGLVERQNRTLKDAFVKYLRDRDNWVECLPSVFCSYRTARHSSTETTPFQVLYSQPAVLPIKLEMLQSEDDPKNKVTPLTISDTIDAMMSIRENVMSKVASNITSAQSFQKSEYDKRRHVTEY